MELYNEEYERGILGALLSDNECFDTAIQHVDSTDFFSPKNQRLYKIIVDMISNGETANIVTVSEKYRNAAEVAALTSLPTAGNIAFYCKSVRDLSLRRTVKLMAEKMIHYPEDKSRDICEIIESVETQLSTVMERKGWNYVQAKDQLKGAIDLIEQLYHSKGLLGVSTGYQDIDAYTGGFIPGELTIIGARASIGKTAIALNFAENIASKSIPVGFMSLEMASQQLIHRLLCGNSGVGMKQIRTGMMHDTDFGRLNSAGEKIYSYPLFIYDYPNAKLLDLKMKARNMHRREHIKILFFDYLGLIRTDVDVPRWEEVGHITSELKALARELNIPVVVCAQVNRSAEGKAPNLANLRESGNIEQDADVVFFLHRKRDSRESELIVAKNRNGGTGKVDMYFIPEKTRFEEMEKSA